MRGKVKEVQAGHKVLRITPAYAGKSPKRAAAQAANGDHPRVCGEKGRRKMILSCILGSPPRMRGKATRAGYDCYDPRITPAYAGKSHCKALCAVLQRDHPRVCGEKKTPS